MGELKRIGMDTSKSVFQLHGVDETEHRVLRRKLDRRQLEGFFAKLAPLEVGVEACGASHHWGRVLERLGHKVKLIAPQYVKAYVKREKNDAADAEAICEAMSRPTMRAVSVKSLEAQAALMVASVRDNLVRRRTQLGNAIRGHAAEFGLIAPRGLDKIGPLLERIAADETLPALAREMLALLGEEYGQVQARLKAVEARLMAWHRSDPASRRLAAVQGIGPIGATLLRLKAPEAKDFASGRGFAAWLGATPRNKGTAGKAKLGKITKAGDPALRAVLVSGAMSVIRQVKRGGKASPWLAALIARMPLKKAAVALANKNARIAWRLMRSGTTYDPRRAMGEGPAAAPAAA